MKQFYLNQMFFTLIVMFAEGSTSRTNTFWDAVTDDALGVSADNMWIKISLFELKGLEDHWSFHEVVFKKGSLGIMLE
eukprot:15159114-Ditylum_brightwellii.AAC.1